MQKEEPDLRRAVLLVLTDRDQERPAQRCNQCTTNRATGGVFAPRRSDGKRLYAVVPCGTRARNEPTLLSNGRGLARYTAAETLIHARTSRRGTNHRRELAQTSLLSQQPSIQTNQRPDHAGPTYHRTSAGPASLIGLNTHRSLNGLERLGLFL
jgi:hypothetical protein